MYCGIWSITQPNAAFASNGPDCSTPKYKRDDVIIRNQCTTSFLPTLEIPSAVQVSAAVQKRMLRNVLELRLQRSPRSRHRRICFCFSFFYRCSKNALDERKQRNFVNASHRRRTVPIHLRKEKEKEKRAKDICLTSAFALAIDYISNKDVMRAKESRKRNCDCCIDAIELQLRNAVIGLKNESQRLTLFRSGIDPYRGIGSPIHCLRTNVH